MQKAKDDEKMIGIVILNYNTWQEVVSCVDSVRSSELELYIVIVDNCSTNKSLDILKERYNSITNINIVRAESNGGYAKGNNIGIEICQSLGIEYCIVANPDVLFCDGSIEALLENIKKHEDVVIAAPQIYNLYMVPTALPLIKRSGLLEYSGLAKRKNLVLEKESTLKERDVYLCSGACFIMRTIHFMEMGAFDEGTFLYNEEACYSAQAKNVGLRILFVPWARVIHTHKCHSSLSADAEFIVSALYYWHKYEKAGFIKLCFFFVCRQFRVIIKMFCGRTSPKGYDKFLKRTFSGFGQTMRIKLNKK